MSNDPLIGRQFGNVRLTALLGQGAMGRVYRAWHDRFAKEVAVKLLKPGVAKGTYKERFLREGRAAAMVRHDNVVQVMDAGEIDGMAYLVLELVNGHSIGHILDQMKAKNGTGALEPAVVMRLGVGMALGLAAIHAKGIVHRDIKPDNVLIGADKAVKITDLGLAKQLDDPDLIRLTGTGMVVGTPLYVAPEAIRDPQHIGQPADVYSLGATLYHMLTGRPPFDSQSAYEVMRSHLEDRPQPIGELAPQVPSGLVQLVERCLAKQPERRPSAVEVADLLGRSDLMHASASRGLILSLTIASLAVSGLATAAWFWLASRPAPTEIAAIQVADATLVLRVRHERAQLRLDQGDWKPLDASPLTIKAGKHVVEVRADQEGPLWYWHGELDLAAGANLERRIELAQVRLPQPQRLEIAGEGMLFLNGRAFGLEPAALVKEAGTWTLGRFVAGSWRDRTWVINAVGREQPGQESTRTAPDGSAWWKSVRDDGRRCPPHHVISWWEADLARLRKHLTASDAWTRQRERPEQPAIRLDPALVAAVLEWAGPPSRLPSRDEALSLADHLEANPPLWCDPARPTPIHGGSANALLVLVPAKETPAAAAIPAPAGDAGK